MKHQVVDLPPAPLAIYRASVISMLRRYFRMSIAIGRLPALLGREFFRAESHTRHAWFEDTVIYVHDIDRCIEKLHHFDRQVIARVVLQEYTREDAAKLLGCTDRHLRTRLAIALDVLAQLFLDRDLMVLATSGRREQAVEDISAADAAIGRESSPHWRAWEDTAWQKLPVVISCQAPCSDQFGASC
jgi:hypothetical protein